MLDQRPALLDDDAHVCLIHNDEAARTRHAVDFIRAAARRGARTLYVSDGRDAREVMTALDGHEARGDPLRRSGRLVLRSPEDSYLADGRFDPESVVGWLREEAGRAQADGCAGLCVTGPMTWATRGLPGSERLVEYERKLSGELAGLGVSVLCQYDGRRFAPALLEQAAASHLRTLRVLPLLEIEQSSGGTVVLVGELDLSNADIVRATLMELIDGRRDLIVDLSRLEFVDLVGVRALMSAAAALEERGGHLELRSPRPAARRLLETTGTLARLSVRQAARDSLAGRPSSADAELRLFRRWAHDREPAAREALVRRFLPLAHQLARRYQRGGEPQEDLAQVASLGLLKAIDRFDPERGIAFSSFAVPTVAGELKRYFRDHGWSVRVPRELQELSLRVERATESLASRLGRAPTPSEVADRLGVSVESVLEARQAAGAHRAESLDRRFDDDADPLEETIGAEDPGFRRAEQSATIADLMSVLSARDREVLRLRFAEDLTQSDIAARLGLSQMHVSRLIRRSLAQLRDAAAQEPGAAGTGWASQKDTTA